ncbi:MAG: hypothetical protein OEU94_13520 [Aquincola sp.]|nr:hypothetical protein [Aquincola sp.]MDH4288981.1 hypothetical protein [Aquincola sp.]MDH5329658.1 hypothetical protein [Aquincola sp.]
MGIVYRKTDKGQREIETRAHRLVPRMRSALILVDGRKSDDDLAKLILTDPAGALTSLLADGFIEIVPPPADTPMERRSEPPVAPVTATVVARFGPMHPHSNAPPAPQGTTPPSAQAPVRKPVSIDSLRRDAVRFLTDQMGPSAEGIALKLERAKTMAELRPLLVSAAQLLSSFHGAETARAFAARFLPDDGV